MWQSLLRHENVQSKVLVEPQKLLKSALWTCLASGLFGPTPFLCLSAWDGEGDKGVRQFLLELAPCVLWPGRCLKTDSYPWLRLFRGPLLDLPAPFPGPPSVARWSPPRLPLSAGHPAVCLQTIAETGLVGGV